MGVCKFLQGLKFLTLHDFIQYTYILYLKVHKIENLFGFDVELYTVSLLVMLNYEGFVTKHF
jgi:hypothetical protein